MKKYELREIQVTKQVTQEPIQLVDTIALWSFNNPYYASLGFIINSETALIRVKVSEPEKLYGPDNIPGTHPGSLEYTYSWGGISDFRVWLNQIGNGYEDFTVEFFHLLEDKTEVKLANLNFHFDKQGLLNPVIQNLTYYPANDSFIELETYVASHTTDFIPVWLSDINGSSYQYNNIYQQYPDNDLLSEVMDNADKQFEVEIPERLFKTEPFPLDQFTSEECKVVAICKKAS